jgi:hypothetical protein
VLLLGPEQLEARRFMARGPLAPLADSLASDLDRWLVAPPRIPAEKALLSRAGGRCERCAAELDFDPGSPRAHRCSACGHVNTGEAHDGWWLYPYQLWLAERAVHAATLYALRREERHAAFARRILTGYADQYLKYPNRDNVLGPSRLFFSTYLESLWLLHICIAADLLAQTGDAATAGVVRDQIASPAVSLIQEYHEGLSNRQVWNAAAIVAARAFLGDDPESAPIADALYDIEMILGHAVGGDGSWYEGDNYHQFAHRGLWYAMTLGERLGYEFKPGHVTRYESGFASPFLSALPDFTYPARKDSRYAASLRQWRFAESCELGLARRDDPVLRWAVGRMYFDEIPAGDTGRWRSSGEAERPLPPVRLSRADLGWRSLLFARETLPVEAGAAPGSLTIMSQGLTIHRRDRGDVYVALDWGESGGGHGHPDRLNLLFQHGASRWLDDLGTGSYVDRSLHWYRSTLAHNAPLVNGASQRRVRGELLAAGARGEFEIAAARVNGIAPGVRVRRTIVTSATYFIDEVRWDSDEPIRFELPVHFRGVITAATFASKPLDGGSGLEDGFEFTHDALAAPLPAERSISVSAHDDERSAAARIWSSTRALLYSASGPGQPATEERRFHLVRQEGTSGLIRTVWSWGRPGPKVLFTPEAVTVRVGMVTHTHHISDSAWAIDAPGALDVAFEIGEPAQPDDAQKEVSQQSGEASTHDAAPESHRLPAEFDLAEPHYRRTEEGWQAAGSPTARVFIRQNADGIEVDVSVLTTAPIFVPAVAVNELDNEHPDINGHGVQLYLASSAGMGAWVIVPEADSDAARVRAIPGWEPYVTPVAGWRRTEGGFDMRIQLPVTDAEFALDVIVNDAGPGRARRRGQLVMSGANGEFAYLRGDRHDPSRLLRFSRT